MNCLFCKLINCDNQTLIYEFNNGNVYLNHNQFFYGRIMYVLKNHWTDISEIPPDEYEKTYNDVYMLTKIIKKTMNADLINIASLGNHVPHMHWHIIPRYKSDPCWGNPPWPHGEVTLPNHEFEQLKKRISSAISSYNE